ncbi:MAG: undecaprenol kinase, partial [Clostridia bacterium]|nr:undecaprenol kinase [Clostridia bacterium]
LFDGVSGLTLQNWVVLCIGFSVSFLTALLVIDKFIKFLTKHSLIPFAYYRLFVGIIILLYF